MSVCSPFQAATASLERGWDEGRADRRPKWRVLLLLLGRQIGWCCLLWCVVTFRSDDHRETTCLFTHELLAKIPIISEARRRRTALGKTRKARRHPSQSPSEAPPPTQTPETVLCLFRVRCTTTKSRRKRENRISILFCSQRISRGNIPVYLLLRLASCATSGPDGLCSRQQLIGNSRLKGTGERRPSVEEEEERKEGAFVNGNSINYTETARDLPRDSQGSKS